MKLGWCYPLEQADLVKRVGFDYLEVALAPMGLEDPATFAAAKASLAACPLPTPAFRVLYPRDMTVVGPDVDVARVKFYLARAAEILAFANASIVVSGSGWSRAVPPGWEWARAEAQFLDALSWCADRLRGTGTTLVVEPLNRKEDNLVNNLARGAYFVRQVNRPEIRLLADFYHMNEEHDDPAGILAHGNWLAHVHLADSGRRNPGTGTYDYATLFANLKAIGYAGRMSAECSVEHPETDMRHSLAFVRQRWRES